jgi:hypothetical protein
MPLHQFTAALEEELGEHIIPALNHVFDRCTPCLVRGFVDWAEHGVFNCTRDVGVFSDPQWNGIHRKFFDLPTGYCWHCLNPQAHTVGGFHSDIEPRDCPHSNLLKPMLFAFLLKPAEDLFVEMAPWVPPEILDPKYSKLSEFRHWAAQPVPDYPGLLNLHPLAFWLLMQRNILNPADVPLLCSYYGAATA